MFGMTEKEFWEDDPQLYWSYQTFYLKKQKLDFERDNQYMWLQGMYIYEGVSVALNNAFNSKQRKSYTKEPYKLNNNKEEEKTVQEVDEIVMKQNNAWARII